MLYKARTIFQAAKYKYHCYLPNNYHIIYLYNVNGSVIQGSFCISWPLHE